MIQQINLYQTELQKKHVPFSAKQMAIVLAGVSCLMIATGAVNQWRLSGLASELSRLQKRQDATIQRLNDYQQKYPIRSADTELVRKIDDMVNRRQAALELLQMLKDNQLGNRHGLSEHLSGLARQNLSTVWLRRIQLGAGGDQLLLEGSSTRAADVPLYLQRLTEQEVFAGREFEHLQLTRPEKNIPIIDFLLQTTLEGEP
jgi:hypothetical protein